MKVKSIVNSKGELQESGIELKLAVGGGDRGIHAVRNLMELINRLKNMEKAEDVKKLWYEICGYVLCCQSCGFLTEKGADELTEIVEKLANIELARAEAEEKGSD